MYALQISIAAAVVTITAAAPARDVNFDENKVSSYTLPALLQGSDSTSITTARQWEETRRPEILSLFQTHVYGHTPALPGNIKFEITKTDDNALSGIATRKHIHITLPDYPQWQGMHMLLYTPNHIDTPVPVFMGLNFFGNHTISFDPDIPLSKGWMRSNEKYGIEDHRATEASRGVLNERWPLELILKEGYGVATAYCGDLEPDHAYGWKDGLRAALSKNGSDTQWKPDDWGALGAWAWGLSRMLDYCETDKAVEAKRAIVFGHSRLGKAALWAAAQDQRFAIAISNNSGEGGAALARRNYGETIDIITGAFPHWFAAAYRTYAQRINELPVDQHMLIALIAPRPVYIASASDDRWADPNGEFLAAAHAAPVYKLYNKTALDVDKLPPLNTPAGETVGYHLRDGKHAITQYDWQQYLNFADRHLDN